MSKTTLTRPELIDLVNIVMLPHAAMVMDSEERQQHLIEKLKKMVYELPKEKFNEQESIIGL